MKKSASEIIRNLEHRVARLENRSAHYDMDEMEVTYDIFGREEKSYQEYDLMAERADKRIRSILKRSRIKYTVLDDAFNFADKSSLVKALEALGVDRRQAKIIAERGTDRHPLNLFGMSYSVSVPNLKWQTDYYSLESNY